LCVLEQSNPTKLLTAITEFYNTFWVQGKPIAERDVYEPALAKVLGSEAEAKAVIEQTATPEIKAHLQRNTDRALEEGAFGLPWFMATNARGETEGFWGFDHLGVVIDHLGLDRAGELKAML